MKTRLLAALLAVSVLPSVAAADDYYLRVGAGELEPSGNNLDRKETSAIVGGWRFNQYLSVEGGFSDLGQYSLPGAGGIVEGDVTSLELGLAAKLAFGDSGLYGQARAGAHRWRDKQQSFEVSHRNTGTDAYYGVGLGYEFSDHYSISLSYDRYGWEDSDLDRMMINFEIR